MPGERRRQQHRRRRSQRGDRQHGDAAAGHEQHRAGQRQPGLQEPDRAEPRSQHRRDDVPVQRLAEPEAACGRALEHDPCERHERKQQRGTCEQEREPRACLRRCLAEADDEHQRAAADQEEKQEVERPHDREQHRHRGRRAALEHLRRHAGRVRTGSADVEDERTRDRMPVRRHRPPRHRVGAAGEPPVERDPRLPLARPLDLTRVDAACLRVVDADRAERRLDRLVEPEQHRPRALLEHRIVRRLGCDQPRVRTSHRHQHERHQDGGDRDEHRPARTTASVFVHLSSLIGQRPDSAAPARLGEKRRPAAGVAASEDTLEPADRSRARRGT